MMRPLALAFLFAQLSVFAIGGATALVPDMQHRFVDSGLLSGPLFTSLVAIAQAAPGPNAMIVGLVGMHIGGLAWGLVRSPGWGTLSVAVTLASAVVAVARPRWAPWTMVVGAAVFAVWGQAD